MKVPSLDLHAQFRSVEADVRAAIERVLTSQQFILGPEGADLERELATYCGCAHAIAVSSGTDAILVSLMALGVGPGDEIITTPYTFVATATCIARLGARAIFVDIDPETYAIDATRVARALSPRTRLILPVHLFGQMADMATLAEIARTHGVPLLEDAAQAIGAKRGESRVGDAASAATLSFFPSKNLGCMGDGGMVVSNDADFAKRVRLLRNQGQQPKYHSQVVGGNFRLDELQAAILRAKLPRLDQWTAARQQNAKHYREAFEAKNIDAALLKLPTEVANTRHVYNQFVVRTPRRDALRDYLMSRGVASTVYYPLSMHEQPCFASWGYSRGDFPLSEAAAAETLALPLYPELEPDTIYRVVDEVSSFFSPTSVGSVS